MYNDYYTDWAALPTQLEIMKSKQALLSTESPGAKKVKLNAVVIKL